jgi:hypothetical protein
LTTTKRYVIGVPIIYTVIQLFNKASIWAIIESFPDIKFAEGDNIHSLTSIITLYTARFFRPAGCMVAAVPVRYVFRCDMDRD